MNCLLNVAALIIPSLFVPESPVPVTFRSPYPYCVTLTSSRRVHAGFSPDKQNEDLETDHGGLVQGGHRCNYLLL